MALNDLLSIAFSASSLFAALDSANVDTIAYADLTGDRIEEKIEFHRSYRDSTDSSFCRVFGYDTDSKDKYILLWKINLSAVFNYRLFVGDYNEDGISDFTITLPHNGVWSYITWDKEKREFISVFEPIFDEIIEADSTSDSTKKED